MHLPEIRDAQTSGSRRLRTPASNAGLPCRSRLWPPPLPNLRDQPDDEARGHHPDDHEDKRSERVAGERQAPTAGLGWVRGRRKRGSAATTARRLPSAVLIATSTRLILINGRRLRPGNRGRD
jgi:hypothetical protein